MRNNMLPTEKETSWLKSLFRKHRKSFSFAEHLTVIDVISDGHVGVVEAIKSALQYSAEKKQQQVEEESIPEVVHLDQTRWLTLLENNNPKSARKIEPALYARLYRNHNTWLMHINHERHVSTIPVNSRVDWMQRDRETAKVLLYLIGQVEGNLSVPRMSKSYLLKHLSNRATIEKNLQRLPRCRVILEKYSEGVSEYQARRLARAFISFRERNRLIKRWSLLREAGLSEKRMTDIVKKLLKEILRDEACS